MALLKPGSGTAMLGGGAIGLAGTSIWIKADSIDDDLSTVAEDVTGDGDTAVVFETNKLVTGKVNIRGWVVAGQASGLHATLVAGATFSCTITYNTGRTLAGSMYIIRSNRRNRRRAATIPCSLLCLFSGTITEA